MKYDFPEETGFKFVQFLEIYTTLQIPLHYIKFHVLFTSPECQGGCSHAAVLITCSLTSSPVISSIILWSHWASNYWCVKIVASSTPFTYIYLYISELVSMSSAACTASQLDTAKLLSIKYDFPEETGIKFVQFLEIYTTLQIFITMKRIQCAFKCVGHRKQSSSLRTKLFCFSFITLGQAAVNASCKTHTHTFLLPLYYN